MATTDMTSGVMSEQFAQADAAAKEKADKIQRENSFAGRLMRSFSSNKKKEKPTDKYARIAREDYDFYKNNFESFEKGLLEDAAKDSSLIDLAAPTSARSFGLAQGITGRDMKRFGGEVTAAQRRQQGRYNVGAGTLSVLDSVNNAAMSQYDLNKQKRASLLDIGQKVYQGSMEGLSTSAKNEAERIKADKAASEMRKAQRTQGIVGGIATGVAVGAVAGAATGAAVGGGLALLAFL
jgi:hypothetical protein